jgi:hypothetical protein
MGQLDESAAAILYKCVGIVSQVMKVEMCAHVHDSCDVHFVLAS